MDILHAVCKISSTFEVESCLHKLCIDFVKLCINEENLNTLEIVGKVKVLYSFFNFLQNQDIAEKTECSSIDEDVYLCFDWLIKIYYQHSDSELIYNVVNLLMLFMKSLVLSAACRHDCEKLFVKQFFSTFQFKYLDNWELDGKLALKKLSTITQCSVNFSDDLADKLIKSLINYICFQNLTNEQVIFCTSMMENILMNFKFIKPTENLAVYCFASICDFFVSLMKPVLDYYFCDVIKNDSLVDRCEVLSSNLELAVFLLHMLFNVACNKSIKAVTKELNNLLFQSCTWSCFLFLGFHKKSEVRKKFCKVLTFVSNYIKVEQIESLLQSQFKSNAFHKLVVNNSTSDSNSSNAAFLTLTVQVLEALQENQTHVVLPVVKKVKKCILEEDISILWSSSILLRMCTHENKTIQKQGLFLFIDPNVVVKFLNHPMFLMLMNHGVFSVLTEDSIYYIERKNLEEKSLFTRLCECLVLCYNKYTVQQDFVKNILFLMSIQNWSSVSLLYMSQAVLKIPSCKIVDLNNFFGLRDLFMHTTKKYDKFVRVCIQQNLICILMKHCKISNFYLQDFVLLLVKHDWFLSSHSNQSLWLEVASWLLNACLMFKHAFKKFDSINEFMHYWINTGLITNEISIEQAAYIFCLVTDGLSLQTNENAHKELIDIAMKLILGSLDNSTFHVYKSTHNVDCVFSFMEIVSKLKDFTLLDSSQYLTSFIIKILEAMLEYFSYNVLYANFNHQQVELCFSSIERLLIFLKARLVFAQWSTLSLGLKATLSVVCKSLPLLKKNDSNKFFVCYYWSLKLVNEFELNLDEASQKLCSDEAASLKFSSSSRSIVTVPSIALSWMCLPFLYQKFDMKNMLELFCEQLDVIPNDNLVRMFEVGTFLFSQITEDCYIVCASCINSMIKITFDLCHSSIFRELYQCLVTAVFQPSILSAGSHSILFNTVDHVLTLIKTQSHHKLGLLNSVINLCKLFWTYNYNERKIPCFSLAYVNDLLTHEVALNVIDAKSVNIQSAFNCIDFFLYCLSYSPPSVKDIKFIEQALYHCDISVANQDFDLGFNVSLAATSILLNLNFSNNEHVLYANYALEQLLDTDKALSSSKSRCHFDSSMHYKRQKIWQNILLLIPVLIEDKSEAVINNIDLGLLNTVESSVRYLMEWALSLTLHRFPAYKYFVLEKLASPSMKGRSHQAVCSYMTIALLSGFILKHQSSVLEQTEYFLELITAITPWCMNQQFTVRLFAHAILLQIHNHFSTSDDVDLAKTHPWIASCLQFANNASGNVKKNWILIQDHFMLFKFDPIAEYSLETIFVTMPRLCFLKHPQLKDIKHCLPQTWLPWCALNSTLKSLPGTSWFANSGSHKYNNTEDDVSHLEVNIQRKIVVDKDSKCGKSELIVIASLLKKPSNLGGLARSCEVFGAASLVLHSLASVNEAGFQALSVTAQKWLNIREVKSHRLKEFLVSVKEDGYVVVGVEQAERSEPLNQFKFPRKSAILLGDEKEGIPSDLFPVLDVCVEIPQVGLVRSLNVHVSGALTVWEYFKQCSYS